jgi:hypothetical protein
MRVPILLLLFATLPAFVQMFFALGAPIDAFEGPSP